MRVLQRTEINKTNNSVDQARHVFSATRLPVRTALIHALLFFSAFSFYVTLWPNAPAIKPDSGSYLRFAQDLSDFYIDQLHERVPGYPILLLLTASDQSPNRSLFHVALVLHFASIWLLANILSRAGLSVMKTILFSLALLLPPFVEPAAYVLSENLAETMLVAAFASLVFWQLNQKTIWILISAASIGCAALTRPTYQLLALAIAAWLITAFLLNFGGSRRWRDVVKGVLILICGSILLIGGYAYFNYRNFGYFGITYKLGISLTQKTVHVIERLPDEYAPIREVLIRGRNADLLASRGTELGYISAIVPELTRVTGLNEAGLSNYLLKLNLLLIRRAPLNYLQEVVLAFGRYCFPTSTELANLNSRFFQTLWAVIYFLLIGAFGLSLVLICGAAPFLKMSNLFVEQLHQLSNDGGSAIRFQGFVYGLAGTIVLYTAVISCFVDVGDPRHRVPTDILIVFMVFLGTHLWWRLINLPAQSYKTAH